MNAATLHRQHSGLTLIELMVALAIGAFLMLGAITVFMQGRTTFRVTESVARLQENGRFALDRLEPDIRMAHYWGLTTRTYRIRGRAAPADSERPRARRPAATTGRSISTNQSAPTTARTTATAWRARVRRPVEVERGHARWCAA